tara:strand:+ start:375 stop:572 length:198 start_codon:yes stop_codon:yes gene_type:complete
MNGWINIEDKNCEYDKQLGYMLLIDANLVFWIGYIEDGLPFDEGGFKIENVTHWQYLPEPPTNDE